MVPGAACAESVTPIMVRATVMASRPFPHHGDDGAGGDERGETLEERLADVLGVVPLGEGAVDAQRLHAAQHEAAPLEARDDLADETAGDAVGLDHDERAFHEDPPEE